MYQPPAPEPTTVEILYYSNLCTHSRALMQALQAAPNWPTLERRVYFYDCSTIRCERSGRSFVVVRADGQRTELPLKVTQLPAMEVFVGGMNQATLLGKQKILVRLGLAVDGPPPFTPPPQQQRIVTSALQYPADYASTASSSSSSVDPSPGTASYLPPTDTPQTAAVSVSTATTSSTSAAASFVPAAPTSSLARP